MARRPAQVGPAAFTGWRGRGRGRREAVDGPAAGHGGSEIVTGCSDCGALQRLVPPPRAGVASCVACGAELERTAGRRIRWAFAGAATTLLLLVPANAFPLMRTWLLGASRESTLSSAVAAMVADGAPVIALCIGLFGVALPFVRYGLLTLALATVMGPRRPAWLGPVFRYAQALQPWAMTEVYLLAFFVAFARLHAAIVVELGLGGVCFIAAGLAALFTRAVLDEAAVWRAIVPDTPATASAPDALDCIDCGLVRPGREEGLACPRCASVLRRREPRSAMRALALTSAAALLYLPANLFAFATLPIGMESLKYTVLEGVIDLADAKLLGLALIVFTASFAIPIAKLGGLAWCVVSVLRRSDRFLKAKTHTYRFVEEIGRWSMVDPFVVACFVPVMSYNAFVHARAEAAAPFFTGVVVLTMLASRAFDPRVMWDAARSAP